MTETQEDVIVLKAIFGKQQGALILSPAKDRASGRLLGVEQMTDDEKRKSKYVADENTSYRIVDGTSFKKSDDIDMKIWNWIKECREISQSIDDAKSNTYCLFYVDQPDKDTENRIKKERVKLKAGGLVENMSHSKRLEICRLMGMKANGMKPLDVEDFLYDVVSKKPDQILKAVSDENYKTRLFYYNLLDGQVIKKDTSGIHRYGDIILGVNEDSVIHWLDDQKNRELVGKFYSLLKGEKTSKQPSVMDQLEKEESEKEESEESKDESIV